MSRINTIHELNEALPVTCRAVEKEPGLIEICRKLDVPGYDSLRDVLERAYAQAATGKGCERHAGGNPFDQQPMQDLIKLYGVGFALGQAAKKAQESQRLPAGRDVAELLGAINYLAGAVIALERGRTVANDNQPQQPFGVCPVCGGNDGHHHEKCTMEQPVETGVIVQIARFNELSENTLKIISNHVDAELLRIQADKLSGQNPHRWNHGR